MTEIHQQFYLLTYLMDADGQLQCFFEYLF